MGHGTGLPLQALALWVYLTALEAISCCGRITQQQPWNTLGMAIKYCDIGDLVSFPWVFVLLETCLGHCIHSSQSREVEIEQVSKTQVLCVGSSTVGIFVVVLFSSLCVHVHLVCMGMEARGLCWVSLPIAFHLMFGDRVSLWPRALTRLVCWLGSSRDPPVPLPSTEINDTCCHVQRVRSVLGIHAQTASVYPSTCAHSH